jgi:hypothetical protein
MAFRGKEACGVGVRRSWGFAITLITETEGVRLDIRNQDYSTTITLHSHSHIQPVTSEAIFGINVLCAIGE